MSGVYVAGLMLSRVGSVGVVLLVGGVYVLENE